MVDFRQLALEFVLEDDQPKLTSIARKAASEIQTAAANTNPVARWVEAVQPWMPGSNDDDVMQDGQDTPDWTARAKALEFLSQTLDFLSKDALKSSQVKLLVAFFGAMFDVDHKAGIKASATALSQIIAMKSFQPQSGQDIVRKVCTLKDDFPRQVSKTRLAVYELLRSLVTDAAVASDLQHRDGASEFMNDLLHLCLLERDPDCLMVWFDILRFFMREYSPSQEMLEEVYGSFKAYFPITLPRASQSIVTPDELKLQLRKCFCATDRLAPLVLPFLIGKLDQGDGVTVNVKVDVLRTIRACIEDYSRPEQSVTPYVNRIWGSLKYEVRNGEVEDTIWATLEVLKAVTSRLKDEELRDYALTVTRDCVNDLSNPTYTAAAGRLLISVLSANPSAFVLMVAPVLTHIKENLRHPKSPMHSQDLLKILRIILETRLLLMSVQMTDQERADFAAVDPVFKTLYSDVYKKAVELGSTTDASYDDVKLSTEAVQGAGTLVCQRIVTTAITHESQTQAYLLLPEGTCVEICDVLFSIASQPGDEITRNTGSDELVNESIQALQRSIQAYPWGFRSLVERGVATMRESYSNPSPESVATIQRLCSALACVGYLDLRQSLTNGMRNFLCLSRALARELLAAIDAKADPRIWSVFAGGIHSAALYFNDACMELEPKEGPKTAQDHWLSGLVDKFPELNTIGATAKEEADSRDELLVVPEAQRCVPDATSAAELRNDGLLITLYICRLLYRRATKTVEAHPQTGKKALDLSDDFTAADKSAEYRYLHQLSKLVDFVVYQMGTAGLSSPQMETYFLSLFRDDFISVPTSAPEGQQTTADKDSWNWLALGPLNVLSFGILKSLRPSGVTRLYDIGVAQQILLNGTSACSSQSDSMVLPVARAIMAALANKYKLEGLADLTATLEHHLQTALKQARTGSSPEDRHNGLEQTLTIFTLAGGLLRRCTGKQTQGLLRLLREAPNDPTAGYRLAQGLETVVAPQTYLTKGSGAVEKPLWMQKVYIELVKPMISGAVGASQDVQDPLIKANFSVGVLQMVKHMRFSIYEDDSHKIARIALSVAQNMGTGPDARAAVEVLKNILVEAPEQAQDHIRSLITVCISLFSSRAASTQARPEWLQRDHASSTYDPEIEAGCGKLALEIVGGLPRMFESRYLLAYAPQAQKELRTACGHRVRDVRMTARLARAAWSDVK
ncbi:DNA repair/transcription protein mms19 [Tolypocladium ophioglossoides CBS 100239]|uniref:MMS19 nucleotide excision repair protein n=1 Tax=Tolypocladium ophioglossoides (strain CBS 100239) TaxID=1163406 RepID=A0A0L0NDW7_TOLOC|nr:DNA repair/transcription protein mms19 [Tolypocladium ophioglossoides CBS 100239]